MTNEIFSNFSNSRLDLIRKYRNIEKQTEFIMPTHKKNITSATLPMLVAQKFCDRFGYNLKNELYEIINSVSRDILTSHDKKYRKRQVQSNLLKLRCGEVQEIDILPLVKESLGHCLIHS